MNDMKKNIAAWARGTKKWLMVAAVVGVVGSAKADTLSDLLEGKYKAATLSQEKIDSVLGNKEEGRYRLSVKNKKGIYRRSFVGEYIVTDTMRKTEVALADTLVREAVISPNGRYIAYVKENNLYLHKLDFGSTTAVTKDEDKAIKNGCADWLYEEEFAITSLLAFSPDSKQLAFVRIDERGVDSCFLDTTKMAYARSGRPIPKAEVMVYDIATKTTLRMPTHDADEECYLPRIAWTKATKDKAAEVVVMKLNRDQNKMEVVACNAKSTVTRPLYKEQSEEYYLDFQLFDEWQWLADNRVVVLSERGGWRSIYLYSAQGKMQKQITADGVDVTKIYGVDEAYGTIYYQQATSAMTRQICAYQIKSGKTIALTKADGIYDADFAADWRSAVVCYQSVNTPNIYTRFALQRKAAQWGQGTVIEDNKEVKEEWAKLGLKEVEFVQTEGGLNGYILLPKGYEKGKKYPVVMTQYSGPSSQLVLNRWRKGWEYYLAEQGYVVACFDARGTDCRGRDWRNKSYMQLGKVEAEDQIAAAKYMQKKEYVDGERICLWGWSYGGYQVLRTMSEKESVFKCGIAIAPVTDWLWYDAAYTERYMRRPQVNIGGYEASSVIKRAADLKGELLLVHGLADDNVHPVHSLHYIEALVEAGKQFDLMLYPWDNHFLKNGKHYEHLHRKIMRFLKERL